MQELFILPETLKMVLTAGILLAAVYSFIAEKVSPDLTALMAVLALMLTGILTPHEAFAGFSHPATISVAAVLVLSAGIEQTGVLTLLARRVLVPLGASEILFTTVIMSVVGLLSAFINNTAAVAIFLPVVLEVCRRTKLSPGRVLMPMSHAATIGGMCTLIGTSTNLVAHEYAQAQGLSGFSMFELGKVGVPMLLVGFAYMLLIGRNFLPRQPQAPNPMQDVQAGNYVAELLVQPNSEWIGKPVRSDWFARDHDLELIGLFRNHQPLALSEPYPSYQAGDSLRVRGPLEQILKLTGRGEVELHRPESRLSQALLQAAAAQEALPEASSETKNETDSASQLQLAEVVVLTPSGLIGQTLKAARFAERFDMVVLALQRRGHTGERPSTTPLKAGDVLAVESTEAALKYLDDTPGFLVLGTRRWPQQRPARILFTLLTLVGVIAAVSFNLLPIVMAATAGCVALMLTGCLRPREAYRAIDLSIVFLLAGSLALGAALEKSGITTLLANGLTHLGSVASPFMVMAGFFLAAVIISEFMSNSGTVPLLAPIAISIAAKMHLNPMALIAAITFGSTAAFAMPIGYQTSLMIYGPGQYRFRDFVRMGLALDALLALLALWLIPRYWPLSQP